MCDPQVDVNEEELATEAEKYLISDLLYDNVARFAITWLGQQVYRRIDSLLTIVEKTARWSMPRSESKSEGDSAGTSFSAPPLVRPLPWILFLPALIVMRFIRAGLSFAALIMGKQPVYPWTVVAFLQRAHRKLRALRYRGQKLRRISAAEKEAEEQRQQSWLQRVFITLRAVVLIRPTGVEAVIYQDNHHHQHHHIRHRSSHICPKHSAGKRTARERDEGDSDDSIEEATVVELLDKYANYDGDSTYSAAEADGEQSVNSESEELTVEEELPESPKKVDEPKKERKSKERKKPKAPKETTGEANSSKGTQEKPHQKSDLNAEEVAEKPAQEQSTPSTNGDAEHTNGEADAKGVNSANRSKSATNLDNEKPADESNTSKSTPNLASAETPSGGDISSETPRQPEQAKSDQPKENPPPSSNQNEPGQQQPHPRSGHQHRHKHHSHHPYLQHHSYSQHHQQQQQQQQLHQQPQQTAANGNNAGGKKPKRQSQNYY